MTAYHLQTDGQTKYFHHSIEQVLRCLVAACKSTWDAALPLVGFALNLSKSAAMGFTPAFVLHSRKPVLCLAHAVRKVIDCPVASVSDKVARMLQTVELVKNALNKTAAAM